MKKILIIHLILLFVNNIFAQEEIRNSRGYAVDLSIPGAFIMSEDDKFTGNSGWINGFTNQENKIVIELGLDEDKHVRHSTAFKICAKFDVVLTDASLVTSTVTNVQLDINYDPADLTRYKDKAQIVFPNKYKVKVYNVSFSTCSISTNCSSCNSPYTFDDAYIQAEVITDRIYSFNFSSAVNSSELTDSIPNDRGLKIAWGFVKGATEYELEYTYIDDYVKSGLGGSQAQSNLFYEFSSNSTRIITNNNVYYIPLTYERGYLIYRVRPVGINTQYQRIEGTWEGSLYAGPVDVAATHKKSISSFSGDTKNWASVKTFAEDGKTGVGVTFSDALGYNRQSLARINTESKSIAHTILYDYYGRPVINFLPSPVTGLSLDYRTNLNMYSGGIFHKGIFDNFPNNVDICDVTSFVLDSITSMGPAKYYSPSNPFKQKYQGYVPDAKGRPFSYTKFKPDATGRVDRQTIPGSTHFLGSDKDIKYFYAQPTQVELDRIFGCEAGRAKYHYKNITIDPNGQISATYLDRFGRTIATSLMGLNPLNLDILPNNVPKVALTEYLHLSPTNEEDPVDRCKTVNSTFFVSAASTEGYVYETTLGTFASTCEIGTCYDCVYDVEIRITDDCGTDILDYDNNVNTPQIYNETIGKQAPYTPVNCTVSPTSTLILGTSLSQPLVVTFPKAGVYTVYKKICVSEAPVQDYTDHFIKNSCNDKKCSLVDSILAMTDFSGCGPTGSCADCMNDLIRYEPDPTGSGTYTTLVTGIGASGATYTYVAYTPPLTPQQLSEALENCEMLCPPKTTCEKYTKTLMADFYPGSGQYAQTSNANVTLWNYSIFNSGNGLPGSVTFDSPPSTYMNAFGTPDFVQLNGSNQSPDNLTQSQYEFYYRKSWAKSFLSNHPEACKLHFYCNIIGASKDYDDEMNFINHFDTACAAGYLNPISATFSTYSANCTATALDPIIGLASAYPGLATDINDFYTEITQNYNGSGVDLYHFTVLQSHTTAIGSNTNNLYVGMDPCTADLDWKLFRNFYQVKKFSLYQKLFAAYSANPASYGFTGSQGCGTAPTGFTSHFPNWMDSLNTIFTGTPSMSSLVNSAMNPPLDLSSSGTNTLSFSQNMNSLVSNINSSMSGSMATTCVESCNSYTNYWHSNLNNGCPAYSSASSSTQNSILAGLVGVCMQGCDYTTNLLGASTASPGTYHTLSGTSFTVNSFQQVLDYYLGSGTCNSYLISQPQPYPNTGVQSSMALSSCKCDQILQVETDFLTMQSNNTLPAGVSAPWQLFRNLYGYDLVEYNILKCLCSAATNGNWTPGYTWSTTELNALAQHTIAVNPKLKCVTCLNCTNVVTALNNFQLPVAGSYTNVIDAIQQDSVNHVAAWAYLNDQFGAHSLQDYIDLYEDCYSFGSTNTFSNTMNNQGLELFHYLNQLVEDKKLTKGPREMKLCTDSKFFLSSLYSESLPSISQYTYNFNITGSVLTFSISDAPNSFIAVVSLTMPSTCTGTWSDLMYLNNMVAYCPAPVSPGANYGFQVNAVNNQLCAMTLTGNVVNMAYPIANLSSGSNPVPALCPKKPKKVNTCAINLLNNALTQAEQLANQYLAGLIAQFQNDYKDACYNAINETFTRQYNGADEYSYTLYYYDQAGNLQRTVPPNGADPNILTSVVTPLPPFSTLYPAYSDPNGVSQTYVSDYRFHSYNVPVQENTIDGGESHYIYDLSGRIVASQNAKQNAASIGGAHLYSYTLYDEVGRISQVGEIALANPLSSPVSYGTYATLIGGTSVTLKKQVTSTFYDFPVATSSVLANFSSGQNNLRSRVSYVLFEENLDASPSTYDFGTFYSYDDHGNVTEIVQHTKQLDAFGQGFKKVVYEFELVSGNMVKATFQPNLSDQLIHKYYYDDDNRLKESFTSKDKINWDRDAKYFYYEHGPLARVERADKKVQGSDYYYTIHGWIKGVNSDALTPISDPGKDATTGSKYMAGFSDIHQYIAKDAAGFSLNYYNSGGDKDYEPIKMFSGSDNQSTLALTNLYNNSAPFYLDNLGAGDGASLYNGNISSMVTSFINKETSLGNNIGYNVPFPQLAGFRYDQLNRITKMKTFRAYSGTSWSAPTVGNYDDSYKMDFSYDYNGNILTLKRNGPSSALKTGSNIFMDDLSYTYYGLGGLYKSNKLACLTDAINSANYTTDVDDYLYCSEQFRRYSYDETGNLIQDRGEHIDEIEWTVDRKVKKITRDPASMLTASVTLSDIEYQYNSQRQRTVKIVKPRHPVTKNLKPVSDWIYTYYSYDASGNVLGVYTRSSEIVSGSTYKDILSLSEHHIYGSNRLAIARPSNTISTWAYTYSLTSEGCGGEGDASNCRFALTGPSENIPFPNSDPYNTERQLGFKEFELTNHLGNVNAVVSDRKIQDAFTGTCVNTFDFNNGVPPNAEINPNNISLTTNSGSLVCTMQSGWISGINPRFGMNIPTVTYKVDFDWDPGTLTSSDAMYLVPYQVDHTYNWFYMGTDFWTSGSVPAAGHYSFLYTPSVSGANVATYFAINTNGSSNHYFKIDNITMCQVNVVASYSPDIINETDYYAFGQSMPARSWSGVTEQYRYGMNGQDKDNEIFDGAMGAEYWEYDSRIGRRWNIDPVVDESTSPYACFANNPIMMNDPDGLKPNWAYTKQQIGRFFRHPIRFMRDRWYRHNGDIRKDGDTKKHWSVGEVFMKIVGAFRGGHYNLSLIPQGYWSNTGLTLAGSGVLNSGQNSGPISITTPPGQYKRRVSQINLLITNPTDDGPPGGYLRVTGIYRHGKDRARYRTMFTNSGGTGFGVGDGGNDNIGWIGGGHSGFLTSIPQLFKEVAMETGGFFRDDGNVLITAALAADELNNRVFSPFRKVSALRVENIFSLKPVGYQLYLRYRQWNWQPAGGRNFLFKLLHDPIKGKNKGLW